MLVDELNMLVAFQQDRKIVEPGDDPLQLDAIHQKHGHRCVGLADIVQKQFLKVSALIIGH